MSTSVKFMIVDQSLRDLNGHYFEYDVSVARAAEKLGAQVLIAGNIDCESTLDSFGITIRRHFERAWTEVHQDLITRLARHVLAGLPASVRTGAIRLGSIALRSLRGRDHAPASPQRLPGFGGELSALIVSEMLSAGDHVFIHTLGIAELHSIIAANTDFTHLPWHHIVLRRDADEPGIRTDQWGGISAVFQRVRDTAHLAARFRFYADTPDLSAQYEGLSEGVRVRVLPIPHTLPATSTPWERRRPGPIRITYLGNARSEKGFQLLPDLVAAMKASHLDTGRVQFVIQANSNMSLEEGTIAAARRALTPYGRHRVELLDEALSMAEFAHRLAEADIVILPYEAGLYRRRSSGIMVQAIIMGCPVVVPEGTWMSSSSPVGAAVTFNGHADLVRACKQAVEELPALRAAATAGAKAWRSFHDAERLVQNLLDRQRDGDGPQSPVTAQSSG